MMESVAILGLGLMGGSLGLALRSRGVTKRVNGYARRESVRCRALEIGAVDAVFDSPEAAVADMDRVVLCTPVLAMPDLVRSLRKSFSEGCMITDVGSTKQWLCEEMGAALAGAPASYIGSHPMAGSEKAGIEAARTELYEGASVLVTPSGEALTCNVESLVRFWESVGAIVTVMSPAKHDAIIARTSHLPHLAAALLVATVDRDGDPVCRYCGPGFRDSTRIAAGPEDVWHDIVKSNADAIRHELEVYRGELDLLCNLLDRGEFSALREWLAVCRCKREALARKGASGE